MLKHEWMQKRDRRARRSEKDDELDDLQAPIGETAEDGAADDAPPLTPDAPPPDTDQDSGSGDVHEPPPPESPAQTPVPAKGRAAPPEPPEPGPFPEAGADETLAPQGEPDHVEPEPDVAGEGPPDEPADPEPEPSATGLGSLLAEEPAREDAQDVVDNLDIPVSTLRDRLEQVLARQTQLPLDIETRHEVSQRAPEGPGEARDELIQRLLDPTLNLQEVATLLGVCRTTVRRYTTRGILRCFRTPGNQRRFHLSDVLDYMEQQHRGE